MKNIEFIVSIGVGFGRVLTGGTLALHKLAYEIASRGYKVTIFTEPEYKHKNIVVQDNFDENNLNFNFNPDSTVMIPNHDWKNDGRIKHVARWVLYHIDKDGTKNFDESDEIFNYGTFNVGDKNVSKKLTVFDYHEDVFLNQNKKRDKKYCFILNKNHPNNWEEILKKQYGADNLTDWKTKGYSYLADRLNEYEFLLIYDDKSFYSLAAAMCGTKVIMLNERTENNLEYKLSTPYNMFGVSCGIEDVEWSEKTISLVPILVNELKKWDNKTVDNFIKFWEEKINK